MLPRKNGSGDRASLETVEHLEGEEPDMVDTDVTQQFIDALAALERERNAEQITALFGPESEVGNIVSPRQFSGVEGARAFWETYRNTFGEVASSFRNVIVSDGRAALEWTTTGTSAAGAPISYEGVSILEMADGKITRFHAYFDPHELGLQIEQTSQGR
jgi:ketosteroid isomerase-like protein